MKIYGRNPVIELLRSKIYSPEKILLQQDIHQDKKIAELIELANSRNAPIEYVQRKQLDGIAGTEPHQGVAAITSISSRNLGPKQQLDFGSYIYIREAQYEHNVGAIIRTAEVAGFSGVIIPPSHEVTPTIVRISMGAIFHIAVYSSSLFPTIKLFKQQGFPVIAIERNENRTIYDQDLSNNSLFIIGGEDKSISPEVAAKCDAVVGIPQHGKVNSLNMSVAAGIVMFEHKRQANCLP